MGLALIPSIVCALLCSHQGAFAMDPSRATFFVATNGRDRWSGTLPEPNDQRTDGPFPTIRRARDAIRAMRAAGVLDRDITVMVRGGTYHMRPVTFGPQDSGTAEHPVRYVAYPGEKPVLSAGRPITGWQRAEGRLWKATVPGVAEGRWLFRELRVGDGMAIRARYPNFDPERPYTGGWLFVAKPSARGGRFGSSVANIHTPADWIEWKVDAPAEGDYHVWLYYGALNQPFGRDNMAGRTVFQVDGGEKVPLENLPDTGGWGVFRWSRCAAIRLAAGAHTIRWTNVEGGGLNFDAFALCTDPNWGPEGTELAQPAQGQHLIVVQAEAFAAAEGKEMTSDEVWDTSARHFPFRPGDLRPWPRSAEAEIHIFPAWGWVSGIIPVDHIDYENRMCYVRAPNATEDIRPGNRYFVDNLREELDALGEWYLDRATGELLYWPTDPAFPDVEVVAPAHDRIFDLRGDTGTGAFVTDIQFGGLTFRDTTYSPKVESLYQPEDAALWLSAARRCVIEGSTFEHIGGYAVRLDNKSCENQMIGNTIADAGEGGIILSGETATQAHDNLIAGNHIHHIGRVYKHVAAVYVTTGSGNRIAHNLVHDTPRYGISLKSYSPDGYSHGNVVEYNEIRRTSLETADTGAIETLGRDNKDSDNVIQYNLIVDSVGLGTTENGEILTPHYTWGVYLDDASSGTIVRGNIIVRNVLGAVDVHGGKNNVIENNIMVEARDHQLFYQDIGENMAGNRFVRNIVCYLSPSANLMYVGTDPKRAVTESDFNVFFRGGKALVIGLRGAEPAGSFDAWRAIGYEEHSVIADPLFVDPAKDDYSLRPDSPAFTLGFQPIDVSKIGLRGYRAPE